MQEFFSESDLMNLAFTGRDAILLSDRAQLDLVMSRANSSLTNCWFMPVTTQACGAVLAIRHDRVRSHFAHVDFADCLNWYHKKGLEHARTWLQELGLHFHVADIDVAELDSPSQFLLFTHVQFVATTVERLLRSTTDIDTFYVVTAQEPLALDFYFDSDVAAAAMLFACQRVGCQVRTIVADRRTHFVFPPFQSRPMTNGVRHQEPAPLEKVASGPRVGFAPATITHHELILRKLRDVPCEILLFPSTWSGPDSNSQGNGPPDPQIYRLSSEDDSGSAAVAAELTELRRAISDRSGQSTLPDSIIRNPYLGFQLDYIVKRRWLAYANMIRRGAFFVSGHPLGLFILSDHFTAEGAILGRLYRREGTRILVVPHSGWPCDANWATWQSSDAAMMPSRSSARRIQKLSGMRDVYVTGPIPGKAHGPIVQKAVSHVAIEAKQRIGPHHKVVVLITNALELNGVPFVDLERHLETVSKAARVPASLQSRIKLYIRTKPGILGEDPTLYRVFSGVPEESLTLLQGLTFAEMLQVADCVVGVNLPTSGYYDVLEQRVPLIHLQLARVATLHPDLPAETIGVVTEAGDVWPAIEAILFDEERRSQVLQIQQQFIDADQRPDANADEDPVGHVIRDLLELAERSGGRSPRL